MSVSEHDVRHVAALARVGIAAEHVPELVGELNRILAHMEVLQQVDVSALDADATAIIGMPLREDVPGSVALARSREEFAPYMSDGFFLVPRLETHGNASAIAEPDDE